MKNGELSGVLKYKPLHPNTPVKDVLREHRAILSALVAQRQTALNPQIGLTAQRLLNETDPKTRKHRSQREVARMLKITQAKLQRQLRDWEDYRSARKHFLATWKKKPRPDSQ